MKRNLKWIGLLLSVVLVLAFTACGSEQGDSGEDTSAEFDIAAGLTRTDDAATGEATVETDCFSVTLPAGETWECVVDGPNSIMFYNIAAREEFGGRLFSVEAFEPEDESYDPMPFCVLGERDGKKIVVTYPSDVQYDFQDEAASAEYLEVFWVAQQFSDDPATSPIVLK